ncbi:MAG: peroxiredoxin family protein [Vampirovibrionales bacterium]
MLKLHREKSFLLWGAMVLGCIAVWGGLSGCEKTSDALQGSQSPNAPSVASPDLSEVNPHDYLGLTDAGKPAPVKTFQAVDGKKVDLKNSKYTVAIFFQGSFCSVCGHQLETYQKHLSTLKQLGVQVVAISHDDKKESYKTIGEHGLSFPVVADPQGKLIKAFGVENIVKHGIAYPSLYVLTAEGTVKLAFADPNGTRLEAPELIAYLKTGKPPVLTTP